MHGEVIVVMFRQSFSISSSSVSPDAFSRQQNESHESWDLTGISEFSRVEILELTELDLRIFHYQECS